MMQQSIDNLSSNTEHPSYTLNPEVMSQWRISNFVLNIFLSGIICVIFWMWLLDSELDYIISLSITVSSIFILFILGFVYQAYRYKAWSFIIKPDEIIVRYGVFNKTETVAPLSRIQHLDVKQGLIERMFGLSTLIIYTAGSKGADIVIPGLPMEYSTYLRDSIKDFSYE